MRIPEQPTPSDQGKALLKDGYESTKWWQALDADGQLLAETSTRSDFKNLNLLGQEGVTIQHLYRKVVTTNTWVEEPPFDE
jgi:hypothetical protein